MNKFIEKIKNPFSFRLFLLWKLPMAFLAGIRIKEVSEERCVAVVSYKYLTQNPFKSIYFACLSMAGEMSTGALAMAHVYNSTPPVSMLVVAMESRFFKKATGKISFICNDGKKIAELIARCKSSDEGNTITTLSEGFNEAGEKVADFRITWSFKSKK